MNGTVLPSSTSWTTASTWALRICKSWAMRDRSCGCGAGGTGGTGCGGSAGSGGGGAGVGSGSGTGSVGIGSGDGSGSGAGGSTEFMRTSVRDNGGPARSWAATADRRSQPQDRQGADCQEVSEVILVRRG